MDVILTDFTRAIQQVVLQFLYVNTNKGVCIKNHTVSEHHLYLL